MLGQHYGIKISIVGDTTTTTTTTTTTITTILQPFFRTTWVTRCQKKKKPLLDFYSAREDNKRQTH